MEDSSQGQGQGNQEPPLIVLTISPICKRISLFLRDLFRHNKKYLQGDGVDLYKKALVVLHSDLAPRVVALIITDKPDDHNQLTENNLPIWKEIVVGFQEVYRSTYADFIQNEMLPPNLTVVTMFKHKKGKMTDSEVEAISYEFRKLQEETGIKHVDCESEEELKNVVDDQVVGTIVQKFRQREGVRKYERRRSQRLAKAKKITKDAYQRLLRGE